MTKGRWTLGSWAVVRGARRVWGQFRVDHICADPQLGLGLSQLWGGVPEPEAPRSSVSTIGELSVRQQSLEFL